MALKGSRELKARLRAIKTIFKPVGREWADETVRLARTRVRVASGRTRASIRRKNASLNRAAVQAAHGARFLEVGTQPHPIRAKRVRVMRWTQDGRPMFAKKVRHPGSRRQPFLRNSARDVLNRLPVLTRLIELWNRAA